MAAGAIAWVGVAALFLALTVQKLWSADTWTLLSIGRWVVEHRAWPRVEEWSYTAAGRDWHELRWLFGVGTYGLWELGGAGLVVVGQSALVGVVFAVLLWGVRERLMDPGVIGVVALGIFAGASRWVMRPELVTYVMVAGFLVGLGALSQRVSESASRGWRRALWALPLMQIVWTNAHPMFVFGPVLAWTAVGAGVAGQIARLPKRQRAKALWGGVGDLVLVAVLVSAACLVNPYGLEGAMQPVRLLVESQSGHAVSRHISEMKSVFAFPVKEWRPDTFAAVGLVGLAVVVVCAVWWRRVGWFRVLVLAQACYLIVGAQRGVGLATVMSVWVALGLVAEGTPRRVWRGVPVVIGGVCLALAMWVVSDRYWARYGIGKQFGLGVAEGSVARGAVDFVIEGGAKGKVYNAVQDGGYLIWRGVVPVYVDGRMEIRSEEFLKEYFEGGWEFWKLEAEKWGINTVVLPRRGFEWLESGLRADATWVRVYEDGRNVIWVRAVPEHAGVIEKWGKRSVGG